MERGSKRMRAVIATAVAVGLGAAGVANAAPGDVVLSGETTEAVKVKLTVATAGNATKFKVSKTKVECTQGGTLDNKSITFTDFDRSDPGSFSDKRDDSSDGGGFHFESKSKLDGVIADDGLSWSGNLKLTSKVFERGEKIDTCKLNTAWDAS